MKKNQGKSNEQHNIVSEAGSDALLPQGKKSKSAKRGNSATSRRSTENNQAKFAIGIIDEISKLLYEGAGTIYHKLKKGLKIEESFYVPQPTILVNGEEVESSPYHTLMETVAEKILSFIKEVRKNGIFSVSMCFTAKDVENDTTRKKSEGFWVPYVFQATKGSNLELQAPNNPLPIRGRFDKDGNWGYFDEEKEFCGKDSAIYKERIIRPHGGISFSERFINQIDKKKDEEEIIKTKSYEAGKCGVYTLDKEKIDDEFIDGSEQYYYDEDSKVNKYTNYKDVRQRSQVIIIPIECRGNQTGDRSKRIGYLQVTGYNFSIGDNGPYVNSDSSKAAIIESKILNSDDYDKLIISTLRCYANYIVLTNKIESVKHVGVKVTFSHNINY